MNVIYWLLPIIVAHLQFIPFLVAGFIIILTPLRDLFHASYGPESVVEMFMFWLFSLLFVLPFMVGGSYVYMLIMRFVKVGRYRTFCPYIFVAMWFVLALVALARLEYLSLFNGVTVLFILLLYLFPFALFERKIVTRL